MLTRIIKLRLGVRLVLDSVRTCCEGTIISFVLNLFIYRLVYNLSFSEEYRDGLKIFFSINFRLIKEGI